jgi:hypothetical protein
MLFGYRRLKRLAPKSNESTKSTRKTKKRIFAIEAAPAAIPPNPNSAATSAMIRNVIVQRNIRVNFSLVILFYFIYYFKGTDALKA